MTFLETTQAGSRVGGKSYQRFIRAPKKTWEGRDFVIVEENDKIDETGLILLPYSSLDKSNAESK